MEESEAPERGAFQVADCRAVDGARSRVVRMSLGGEGIDRDRKSVV